MSSHHHHHHHHHHRHQQHHARSRTPTAAAAAPRANNSKSPPNASSKSSSFTASVATRSPPTPMGSPAPGQQAETMSSLARSASPTQQSDSALAAFCREVRNLLRSKPNCVVPFSKFVPAYHNHYGRQCCVYQFGFTKLIELLEAIPNVVQILDTCGPDGSTSNRYITLTHREQIKRFASDLIKVVKSRPGKRLRLSQFASAYEQVLGRTFRVEDYGTNNINVLLAEIWEGTINIIPIRRGERGCQSATCPECSCAAASTAKRASASQAAAAAAGENQAAAAAESDSGNDADYMEQQLERFPGESDAEGASSAFSSAASSSTCGSLPAAASCSQAPPPREPLFVDVPLPKNCPVLEQLVAQSGPLTQEPYITRQHPDCWFEIPRRERSEREIKRTKYFVWDCIELLTKLEHSNYSVPFSKFIPAYHYYFNRQCKVSIFGFSKLIDLFESIAPQVVEILDQGPGEEKLIRLAPSHWPKQPIDCGPTEEELRELERELEDYEQQLQCRRSTRMAAIF